MYKQTFANGLPRALLITPLLWAGLALSADAPRQLAQEYLELDEVLVKGRRPAYEREQASAWLSRLVGQFRYEGYVERRGSKEATERAEVQGSSQCRNMGAPAIVQCLMNVTWPQLRGPDGEEIPGGASYMIPAVAMYGLFVERGTPGRLRDPQYIGHVQVDSRGLADAGKGQLFEDTLIYKAPCADLPGDCQRVVEIEAPPDGKVIRMSVDVQRDSKSEVRYFFQWHRLPPTQAAVDPQPIVAARASNAIMPASTQVWLRRMVGYFQVDDGGAYKTKEECQAIGNGPGSRCVVAMGWQEDKVGRGLTQASFQLWGYDPVAGNIVHAFAGPGGFDWLGGMIFYSGPLKGNKLTYMELCPQMEHPPCPITYVTAQPGGEHVVMDGTIGNERGGYIGRTQRMLTRIGDAPPEIALEAPRQSNPSPRKP